MKSSYRSTVEAEAHDRRINAIALLLVLVVAAVIVVILPVHG